VRLKLSKKIRNFRLKAKYKVPYKKNVYSSIQPEVLLKFH